MLFHLIVIGLITNLSRACLDCSFTTTIDDAEQQHQGGNLDRGKVILPPSSSVSEDEYVKVMTGGVSSGGRGWNRLLNGGVPRNRNRILQTILDQSRYPPPSQRLRLSSPPANSNLLHVYALLNKGHGEGASAPLSSSLSGPPPPSLPVSEPLQQQAQRLLLDDYVIQQEPFPVVGRLSKKSEKGMRTKNTNNEEHSKRSGMPGKTNSFKVKIAFLFPVVDVMDYVSKSEDRNRRVGQNMRSSG